MLKQNIPRIEGRPGESLPSLDFSALEAKLRKTHGNEISDCDVMSAALYPKVAEDFFRFRATNGPVVSRQIQAVIPTRRIIPLHCMTTASN